MSLSDFPSIRDTYPFLLLEALVVLAVVSIAIGFFPFRRVADAAAWPGRGREHALPEQDNLVARCRQAVEGWGRRVPWKAVCFQKGLALHLLLRRRGVRSTLHYGVNQGDAGLSAHVWVMLGDEIILGGGTAANYTCLAVFPGIGPAARRGA
jgi:hypothetical protein